jgi:hypothetical protein
MTDDLDDLTDEERDRREAEFLEALSRQAGEFIIGMVRRFAPVQLLFGYFGISQQAADHDYDAISSLGCGVW